LPVKTIIININLGTGVIDPCTVMLIYNTWIRLR